MISPLKANALSSLLQNIGFNINPIAQEYMGSSIDNDTYTMGTTITSTCLYDLTRAINLAYPLIGSTITSTTYDNLISIGSATIPALGNSKPPTYIISDPTSGPGSERYAYLFKKNRVTVKNNSPQLLFNTSSLVTVPSGSNPSTSSYAICFNKMDGSIMSH